jgi:hypothetical protein
MLRHISALDRGKAAVMAKVRREIRNAPRIGGYFKAAVFRFLGMGE